MEFLENILPFASNAVYGGVQIATSSQLSANTSVGSTGARLVVPCDLYSPGAGSLAGLSDVDIDTPLDQQLLVYNIATSKWENQSVSSSNMFSYSQNLSETTTTAYKYNLSANPCKYYALQVNGVGGNLASWEVTLDGDLNNADVASAYWTNILNHKSGTATEGSTILMSNASVFTYLRIKVVSLSLGTATAANILFTAIQ